MSKILISRLVTNENQANFREKYQLGEISSEDLKMLNTLGEPFFLMIDNTTKKLVKWNGTNPVKYLLDQSTDKMTKLKSGDMVYVIDRGIVKFPLSKLKPNSLNRFYSDLSISPPYSKWDGVIRSTNERDNFAIIEYFGTKEMNGSSV